MRACSACGASYGSEDDFCGNCGAYLGWSDTSPASCPPTPVPSPRPGTPPPARPADAPGTATPAPGPAPRTRPGEEGGREETEDAGSPRSESAETGQAGEEALAAPSDPAAADSGTSGAPGTGDETGSGEDPSADTDARTATGRRPRPAPAVSGAGGESSPAPATQPAAISPRAPGPTVGGTTAQSASQGPAADPVLPVRPARPVSQRPAVRPAEPREDVAGAPCPSCGAPNPDGRRFCRRCGTVLDPAAGPERLPWWRTVWPFRRRTRASSGRLVRFWVILAVVAALCAVGVLLWPAARGLYEDTQDKLGKPKPVTPRTVKASDELPRHPATNTTDGLNNRYWGAAAPGASVTYTFSEPFRLVELLITNGPSAAAEDYTRQARALTLDLEVTTEDGGTHHKRVTLSDKPGEQSVSTGISDVSSIRLVLHSAVGLSSGRHLALAEVEFFQRG